MKIKTRDLRADDGTLDWAVAEAMKRNVYPNNPVDKPQSYTFCPSTNWEHGGPIIEQEKMTVGPQGDKAYWAGICDVMDDDEHGYTGPTPLIAAMRRYVASKFGHEVEIPKQLAKQAKVATTLSASASPGM